MTTTGSASLRPNTSPGPGCVGGGEGGATRCGGGLYSIEILCSLFLLLNCGGCCVVVGVGVFVVFGGGGRGGGGSSSSEEDLRDRGGDGLGAMNGTSARLFRGLFRGLFLKFFALTGGGGGFGFGLDVSSVASLNEKICNYTLCFPAIFL